MIRSTVRLGLAAATLAAAAGAADAVTLTDPRTGATFSYRPSFAPPAEAEVPTRDAYDPAARRWAKLPLSPAERQALHAAKYARVRVPFRSAERPGTVIVDTLERYLYLVERDGTAIRYGVGVGREGFTWSGVERISRKAEWPDWTPPAEMLDRRPDLPTFLPGGPDNPLGARALYLGSTLYRIHGTDEDGSIGTAVSSGCIRLRNADITDLYERVRVGTEVLVLGPDDDRSGLTAALGTD